MILYDHNIIFIKIYSVRLLVLMYYIVGFYIIKKIEGII